MSAEEINRLAVELRPHYRRFLGHHKGEILLTAHSHQAWPDVAREGQVEAWDDAARLVDQKWGRVFGEILPELQQGIASRLGTTRPQDLALGVNTHELVYRLLTCFPPNARILTTDSEFHSLTRQLARSEEEGLVVTRVPAEPGEELVDRMVSHLRADRPNLLALSQVFFTNGRVVEALPTLLGAAAEASVPVLVDAYHSFGVLNIRAEEWPGSVFVTSGGYKYAQCGEGVCFLLLPSEASRLRPAYTGWMADFAGLENRGETVRYGPGGQRFFGATFDPTPWYRSVHVFRWMDRVGLIPPVLERAAQIRTERIIAIYDQLGLNARGLHLASPRENHARGGFVAFSHPEAPTLSRALRENGVHTDARGDILRLGPAPYTSSDEIDRGLAALNRLLS